MMVIRDVTSVTGPAVQTVSKTDAVKTTITPFKKVLESEQSKVASDSAASSDASNQVKKMSTVSSGQIQKMSTVSTSAATASGSVSSADNDSALSGKTTLDDLFKEAAKKYDISYDFLVAVAKAESDFDPKCVSSAGAKGIMQLMPDECKEFGVTDPFDERQNIMASAKLLKAHLKKFNGNFTLAAAAYNAGSGAVNKYGGVPPYTETQNYVKKIAKYMAEGVTVPDRTISVEDEYSGGGGSTGQSSKTASTLAESASAAKSADSTKSSASTKETDSVGQTAQAASSSSSSTSVSSTSATESSASVVPFDEGKKATAKDWEKVLITVGSGSDKVTMTYGAYLKYLELGTTGVG